MSSRRRATRRSAAVINTSSTSGLFGNVGQTNYGAAKTGIATFSIIADQELSRYGVRVNAIVPAAATPASRHGPTGARGAAGARVDADAPGQRLAVRRVPRDGGLPDPRPCVLRAGRRGVPVPAVRDRRPDLQGRRLLDDRGAPGAGAGSSRTSSSTTATRSATCCSAARARRAGARRAGRSE